MLHPLDIANIDAAFGFLGGKEVKEAGVGNLGLQDRKSKYVPSTMVLFNEPIQQSVKRYGGSKSISQTSEATLTRSRCKLIPFMLESCGSKGSFQSIAGAKARARSLLHTKWSRTAETPKGFSAPHGWSLALSTPPATSKSCSPRSTSSPPRRAARLRRIPSPAFARSPRR